MKRHGNLFERIASFDNLELAYRKASLGRRYVPAVLRFGAAIEESLIQLHNELMWKEYQPRPCRRFVIYEPKERVIHAAAFRDRVVHHAIMNVVEPIWDGLFIEESFACRTGRGTHAGVLKLDRMLQSAGAAGQPVFCLKGDVAKFFPSINHHVLMAVIRRKIKCSRTLDLFKTIVFVNGDPEDPLSHDMPIGNLVSQWAANLYLNELDQFVKHQLKARHYMRYMDDTVILHTDKRQLLAWKNEIDGFLRSHLLLATNSKTAVFPVMQGIDFLGYRTWPNGRRLLRKSSARRMVQRLKALRALFVDGKVGLDKVSASVRSWIAHCNFCESWRVRARVLRGATFGG